MIFIQLNRKLKITIINTISYDIFEAAILNDKVSAYIHFLNYTLLVSMKPIV